MKWLRPVVSIALLAILLAITDVAQVVTIMSRVNPALYALALILFALSILSATWKWHLFLPSAPFGALLRTYLSSLFFFLLPTGTLGAEASKLVLTRTHRLSLTAVAGSIVMDKLSGLLALALIGAVAGLASRHALGVPAGIMLLCASLAFLAGMYGARSWELPRRLLSRAGGAGRKAAVLFDAIVGLGQRPGVVSHTLAMGIVSQGLIVTIYACLATGLGLSYPLPEFTLCVVLANFAAIVPVSMAGLGVRELGLVALLAQLGISAEGATALALAVFSVFVIGALAGFINQLLPSRIHPR
jgi:glycosyltransferase 2 family protein